MYTTLLRIQSYVSLLLCIQYYVTIQNLCRQYCIHKFYIVYIILRSTRDILAYSSHTSVMFSTSNRILLYILHTTSVHSRTASELHIMSDVCVMRLVHTHDKTHLCVASQLCDIYWRQNMFWTPHHVTHICFRTCSEHHIMSHIYASEHVIYTDLHS